MSGNSATTIEQNNMKSDDNFEDLQP